MNSPLVYLVFHLHLVRSEHFSTSDRFFYILLCVCRKVYTKQSLQLFNSLPILQVSHVSSLNCHETNAPSSTLPILWIYCAPRQSFPHLNDNVKSASSRKKICTGDELQSPCIFQPQSFSPARHQLQRTCLSKRSFSPICSASHLLLLRC